MTVDSETALLPVQRLDVVARGEAEATELIRRLYDEDAGGFHSEEGATEFRLQSAAVGDLHVELVSSSFDYRIALAPMDQLVFFDFHRGGVVIADGHEDWSFGPGDSGVYQRGVTQDVRASGISADIMGLPWSAVVDAVEGMGIDGRDLRFESMMPATVALARQWRQTMRYLHDVLLVKDSMAANPLVTGTLQQLAAAAAIATFPNTAMDVTYQPGPGFAAPATVRRAIEYIEAHAAEPITLADIARAAGVTGRALQFAFRRHHGMTPMAYLRQVRLDSAHRELLSADPTRASVAQIAARHGFPSANRFTSWYRASYGVPPSRTLRN
jgi:AraC-like DNA-binding protein